MKALGYLWGGSMILAGSLMLLSPRGMLGTYRRWRGRVPRPVEGARGLSDRALRGIALWEVVTGCLLVALARRSHD
ncbi:MAG: hypothetical protein HY689_15375 [Chloroflexi bacterium]|nr:hypothetical protein [Chloroflexota bacterium]